MSNKIGYNGKSKKRNFYKIRKHIDLLKKRVGFQKQKNEIEAINNDTLNAVLESILAVKYSDYDQEDLKVFKSLDEYRQDLLNDTSLISYEIFNSNTNKQVKDICKTSSSPKKWGQLLYALAKHSSSTKVLEIGTNVGISGSYFLSGLNRNSNDFKFITMEGVSQLCSLSQKQFETIVGKDKFEIIPGLYEDTFQGLIEKEKNFDLLFLDGNHQKEPTLDYFTQLKKHIADKAIFIFDDIYYNTEMTEAWNIIIEDEVVNFSIDMYKLGIAIIDKSEQIRRKSFGIHLTYD